MKLDQFITLLSRHLSREASPEESSKLQELLQEEKYRSYFEWLQEKLKSSDQFNLQKGKNQLLNKIRKHEPDFEFAQSTTQSGKNVSLIKKRWLGVIAASVLLLTTSLAIFYGYNQDKSQLTYNQNQIVWTEKSTGKAERKKIQLPDGSSIILNAQSYLKYPKDFKGSTREVYLEGEAYFEVQRNENKPFKVYAQNTLTQVLGTKFNVQAYPEDDIKIALLEGKVAVRDTLLTKSDTLQPLQQWVWNIKAQSAQQLTFKVEQILGWKDNHLVFDNETLEEIAKRLERHFGAEIKLENKTLEQCRHRGNYKNESLKKILEAIHFISGGNIRYELKGNVIYIKGSC